MHPPFEKLLGIGVVVDFQLHANVVSHVRFIVAQISQPTIAT